MLWTVLDRPRFAAVRRGHGHDRRHALRRDREVRHCWSRRSRSCPGVTGGDLDADGVPDRVRHRPVEGPRVRDPGGDRVRERCCRRSNRPDRPRVTATLSLAVQVMACADPTRPALGAVRRGQVSRPAAWCRRSRSSALLESRSVLPAASRAMIRTRTCGRRRVRAPSSARAGVGDRRRDRVRERWCRRWSSTRGRRWTRRRCRWRSR